MVSNMQFTPEDISAQEHMISNIVESEDEIAHGIGASLIGKILCSGCPVLSEDDNPPQVLPPVNIMDIPDMLKDISVIIPEKQIDGTKLRKELIKQAEEMSRIQQNLAFELKNNADKLS